MTRVSVDLEKLRQVAYDRAVDMYGPDLPDGAVDMVLRHLDPQPIGWQPIADMSEEMKWDHHLLLVGSQRVMGVRTGSFWAVDGYVVEPSMFCRLPPIPTPTEGGE